MIRPVALLLLIGCAACATRTEWARADTAPEQRQKDEKDCHDIASWQALDESDKTRPIYPPFRDTQFIYGGDDGGDVTTSYTRRGPRMYELSIYCMEQRGYRLQRIAQPQGVKS